MSVSLAMGICACTVKDLVGDQLAVTQKHNITLPRTSIRAIEADIQKR